MSPAAYWASAITVGIILAIWLSLSEATLILTSGWVGAFLLVTAMAYRPRRRGGDELADDDGWNEGE